MIINKEISSFLFNSATLLFISNFLAFIFGALINYQHKISTTNVDVISGLTEDNKGYQALIKSLKDQNTSQQIQINTLKSNVGEIVGKLQLYERLLENRSPDFDRSLASINQFIIDARTHLSIPESNNKPNCATPLGGLAGPGTTPST